MPRAILLDIRREVISRCRQGENQVDIAADLDLHYRTVRVLWRRYRERGDEGLVPDYAQCGRQELEFPVAIQEAACALREEHPDWSAAVIHQQLGRQFTEQAVPSARSLQRWFRLNGCNRHRGRPSAYPAQVGVPDGADVQATD